MVAVVSISWWFCFEGRERSGGWLVDEMVVNPALVARWLASREGTPNCWLSFGNLKEHKEPFLSPGRTRRVGNGAGARPTDRHVCHARKEVLLHQL